MTISIDTPPPISFPVVAPQAGGYLSPPGLVGSSAIAPGITATAYAVPLIVPEAMTFDKAVVDLVTLGVGSAEWCAVYQFSRNPNAGAPLVFDFGQVDLSSGSGSRAPGGTVSAPFQPGNYWAVAFWKNTATPATIMGMSALHQPEVLAAYATNQRITSYAAALAYPASAPLTMPTGLAPNTAAAGCFWLHRSA